MYNTDRFNAYYNGEPTELREVHGYEIKGKEFARGYGGYRPRTVYNMGAMSFHGYRTSWDLFRFIGNLLDVLQGVRLLSDFRRG